MHRLVPVLVLVGCVSWWGATGAVNAARPLTPAGGTALTSYLQETVSRGNVPGVVVAVVDRDEVLYHEAFGMMNAAAKTPMAKDAIFNIASMTKPITSVAVIDSRFKNQSTGPPPEGSFPAGSKRPSP